METKIPQSPGQRRSNPLYSLEKLIEWKPEPCLTVLQIQKFPLLAREINWMETNGSQDLNAFIDKTLYSLEKLIEWKRFLDRAVGEIDQPSTRA